MDDQITLSRTELDRVFENWNAEWRENKEQFTTLEDAEPAGQAAYFLEVLGRIRGEQQ